MSDGHRETAPVPPHLDAASTAPTSQGPATRLQSPYYQHVDVSVMDMWIISLRSTLLSVRENVMVGI